MDDNGTNLDQTAQVREELHRILPVLSRLTGLPSRWNGELVLVPDAGFKGKKLFSCSILLDASLATQEVRWRTLIHEALHALSAGYNQSDYNAFTGWEEGVAEQLQRLIRPKVLAVLGVSVRPDVFSEAEAGHLFNPRIRAVESLRIALGISEQQSEQFYIDLLATPIKSRISLILGMANRLENEEYRQFIRVFSLANSILKG